MPTPQTGRTLHIGEGFEGPGVNLAHINVLVGPRNGPAGQAFATALATPSAGHAPFVASLRPGILTVTTSGTHQKIVVLGGLAEMSDKGLTVLADVATSIQDLDRTKFADKIAAMEAKLAEKEGSELDRAIERLDHFKSIQNQLNSTAMH